MRICAGFHGSRSSSSEIWDERAVSTTGVRLEWTQMRCGSMAMSESLPNEMKRHRHRSYRRSLRHWQLRSLLGQGQKDWKEVVIPAFSGVACSTGLRRVGLSDDASLPLVLAVQAEVPWFWWQYSRSRSPSKPVPMRTCGAPFRRS